VDAGEVRVVVKGSHSSTDKAPVGLDHENGQIGPVFCELLGGTKSGDACSKNNNICNFFFFFFFEII
jgi:hypothetical protein